MTREALNRELRQLQEKLLALAGMAKSAIGESVRVLDQRDAAGAQRIIDQDQQINERRFAIEADTLATIATQQPMAGDLRTLAAILEVSTELERIADYGKGIARISLMMGNEPPVRPLVDIPRMADRVCAMLDQALDAFIRRDVELARAIPAQDSEVDAMYNRVYREMLDVIVADQQLTDRATHLLWVAHNLERAADRVTNICERVVFTVTGEMAEMDVKDLCDAMARK